MNDQMLLLKTMLVSTSNINILKHSDDKKKRGLAWGNIIGFSFIYLILAAYTTLTCYGMAFFGMQDAVPMVPAVVIIALSFFFTIFKAHGLLFGYREYDMLMAMPFSTKAVVANRFLYMYIKNLLMTCVLSFSSLIGYVIAAHPGVITCVWWIVLTFALPVIPMLAAVALSALIGGLGAGFKHKNAVLTVLTFVFVIPLFFLRFFIEDIVRNDKIEEVMGASGDIFGGIAGRIPMAGWFADTVNTGKISSALLLIGISILAYELVFMIFAKFYKSINSKMSTTHSSHERVKGSDYKVRNGIMSVAYKDFKRFSGSVVCTTNIGMGMVLSAVFAILILFVNVDSLLSAISGTTVDTKGLPIMLIVPVFVYFFTGMVPWTACAMSLEGKNYWIVKSLPYDNMTIYKGKMLFNLILFTPVSILAVITSAISFKASVIEVAAGLLFAISTCLFSTTFGMRCGVKHMQLDWDNEIQVVKQGRAVTSYLLPNMFATMFIGGGLVALGLIFKMLPLFITIMSAVYLILSLLSYGALKRLARKM